jgi:UDP-N-acetylmuramate dehydrogenase
MHMAEPLQFAPGSLRGVLTEHEPMAKHVTWRAGGPARRAYVPADREDLCRAVAALPAHEAMLFVGLGSNLLVRDGGFPGTVVLMHHTRGDLRVDGDLVYADAGMAAPKVARFAATHGYEGAEFLAGVPGTVGGALAMNAGCYGSETWNHVVRVETVDRAGGVRVRAPEDYGIGYRTCIHRAAASEEWFLGAWFHFAHGDAARARSRITELLAKRVATQPLNLPNAGSVFRNPPGDHAARLIEACGLKGVAIGGARISEKHANFIVNPDRTATASDIEALIAKAQATVRARFGIELHTEVRIVGEAP